MREYKCSSYGYEREKRYDRCHGEAFMYERLRDSFMTSFANDLFWKEDTVSLNCGKNPSRGNYR